MLSIISLAACSSNGPTKVNGSGKSSTSVSSTKQTTFKVGDVVNLDGVELVVNSATYNAGGQYTKPDAGNQYVIVNVTITNKSKDSVDYNPFDFKLDDNGNQTSLSEYATDDSGNDLVQTHLNSGTLTKGGSVTGSMMGQAKLGDKYKLVYTGNMFDNKSKITFELN